MSVIFSSLTEICPANVCFRILRMINESAKVTLEDIANDIKSDSVRNLKKSGEGNYINRISGEMCPKMFPLSVGLQLNAGYVMNCTLIDFVLLNFTYANVTANEDIRKSMASSEKGMKWTEMNLPEHETKNI
ncbi:hypothetical protein ACTXT7_009075 [Hymenolepis weldensis]